MLAQSLAPRSGEPPHLLCAVPHQPCVTVRDTSATRHGSHQVFGKANPVGNDETGHPTTRLKDLPCCNDRITGVYHMICFCSRKEKREVSKEVG
mmetsp:Transcript_12594/g.29213  ORF Transcript_12594/g.29213 Transcript_12594/m.29213 type:complete len:94 (+) Transcript_12594:1791-2072(+)